MDRKRVLIVGAAGRVGSHIAAELLRAGLDVALVDVLPQSALSQRAARLLSDARLACGAAAGSVQCFGDVDVLQQAAVVALLDELRPDLVINYAIPVTWDATKRLANYSRVSAAGLGAFTPVQVCGPLSVGRAIAASSVDPAYIVGNLPDITIPVLSAAARRGECAQPLCGAGNVGLNEIALRSQVADELAVPIADVSVSLVSHHVHWVAPREPGYSNAAPFLARIEVRGRDVTGDLGDVRELMNRGVRQRYEPDAAFSSTTGVLASCVALALLVNESAPQRMHVPAPGGLPGGYPVLVGRGEVSLDLPADWNLADAVAAMSACHQSDGVKEIDEDGAVTFTDAACAILDEELGFALPQQVTLDGIEALASAQIACLRQAFIAAGAA